MGLRSRLKRVIFGQNAKPTQPSSRPMQSTSTPPTPSTDSATNLGPATSRPVSSPPASPTVSAADADIDPKVLKHRNRTISALLQLAMDNGGTASLGDLHDLAERRYFIAHKAFSDLMEDMVDKGVFQYDWGTQVATVTEVGQAFLEEHPPRKKG